MHESVHPEFTPHSARSATSLHPNYPYITRASSSHPMHYLFHYLLRSRSMSSKDTRTIYMAQLCKAISHTTAPSASNTSSSFHRQRDRASPNSTANPPKIKVKSCASPLKFSPRPPHIGRHAPDSRVPKPTRSEYVPHSRSCGQ